ncbi:bile salt-activated lipase-like [Cetorhinus maximus]
MCEGEVEHINVRKPNFPKKVPVIWPKYNKRNSQYLQLDINLSRRNIKEHLKPEQVTFWNQYIPSLLKVKECPITEPLPDPLVPTQNGLLRGFRIQQNNKITDIFKGIPYAQPPIGELRFQKPRPLNSWKGIKDAKRFGNICLQDQVVIKDVHGEEDCLFLNIWIPNGIQEALRKKLAVMVWIHGGAFVFGAGQSSGILDIPMFDGNELAHSGEVIVVTLNYRLAALGFLSTGDDNGRGNYALWDQRMAIAWVKNNIANFGGDPELITLFGESAGGASTSMHALSPVNRGLFRRVISQSGDAQAMWTVNRNPLRAARRVAQAVGCPLEDNAAMMFCLRQVPAKDIVLAIQVKELLNKEKIVFFLPFAPTIDGDFLPSEPVTLFENSRVNDYLLGCNSGDAHLFVSAWFPGVNIPFGIDQAKFRTAVEKVMGSLGEAAVESAIFEYTDWENPTQLSRRKGLSQLYTDFEFCSPAFSSAQKHAMISGNASRTYAYQFSYPSKMPNVIWPEWIGALHTEELQYLFGRPFSMSKSYNNQERELSKTMMRYWTNFAKTGNPNYPQSVPVNWPEHGTEKHYMELNVNLNQGSVGSNLRPKQFTMWNELISKMVSRNLVCLQDQIPALNGTVPVLNPPIVTIQQGQVKGTKASILTAQGSNMTNNTLSTISL